MAVVTITATVSGIIIGMGAGAISERRRSGIFMPLTLRH
jgi:hypothetical protein